MDKARVKQVVDLQISIRPTKKWGKLESLDRLECSEVSNLLTVYKLGSIMDVRDAVASRYSCRAFLPTPVPEAIVRDILAAAARAPSGGNVQPWCVHALAGAKLEQLKALVRARPELLPRASRRSTDRARRRPGGGASH